MAIRWSLLWLGFFLVAGTGCTGPEVDPPVGPPPGGNRPPVIIIDGPATVAKGTIIRFDASNTTDPEEHVIEFFWEEDETNPDNNFFDGVTLNEPRIQIFADVVGTFHYTLTATDELGMESSSPVTLTVTPKPGAAPVVTGVKINGVLFDFATHPTPTAFTAPAKTVSLVLVGTDVDSPSDQLKSIISAPFVAGNYTTPSLTADADGFHTVSVQVALEDPEEHTSDTKTLFIRTVPKALSTLKPRAVYVNCAALGAGTGTEADPYQSIQAAYDNAAAQIIRPDVYIASGTCTQSILADFKDVDLYGLFEPSNGWTRRTDVGTSAASRFQAPTILVEPTVESLLYTVSAPASGGLLIDGITFKLSGLNFFGIDLTSPVDENETLIIQNSEFIGLAVTSANFKVGGGIQIKQGPSTNQGPIIRRNFFSVGAADGGSRFQVLATHKGNPTNGSRKKLFYSNVFHGGIGFSTSYSCNASDPGKPYAFCLYRSNGDDNSGTNHWTVALRNLLWITSGNAGSHSTVLTAGGGHLVAVGNVFKSTGATHPLRFLHGWTSEKVGDYGYNAFPEYSSTVTYVVDDNATPNSYNCIGSNPGDGNKINLGKDPGSGCDNYTPSANANAIGSFIYTTLSPSPLYPWRLGGAQLYDKTSEASLTFWAGNGALWDFDGRYGAANDDGVESTKEYNAGPFESAAPNP